MDPLNILAKFEIRSLSFPVPEIIGGTRKIFAVPGYAHASFFSWAFIRMDPVIVLAKFEVHVALGLPVWEIIPIGVLGGVRTPNLGKGRP